MKDINSENCKKKLRLTPEDGKISRAHGLVGLYGEHGHPTKSNLSINIITTKFPASFFIETEVTILKFI